MTEQQATPPSETPSWQPEKVGSGWVFRSEAGPRFEVSAISPSRGGGLSAWCEVWWGGEVPLPRLVNAATRNLMGPTTPKSLADAAKQSLPDVSFPWLQAFTNAVYFVVGEQRKGVETVELAAVEPGEKPRWLLKPFIQTGVNPSRLIAEGGAGKSMLALALSATQATGSPKIMGIRSDAPGPVLYLDWETDAAKHAERLTAVAAGAGLPKIRDVLYQRHYLPLFRSAEAVARVVAENGVTMLVVDSVMMARGSSDGGSSEDTTIKFYEALAEIGVPCIVLDHKSKDQINRKSSGGYGSIVTENSARVQWEIKRRMEMPGGDEFRLVLAMSKTNNTRMLPDKAYSFRVVEDRDRMVSMELREIAPGVVLSIDPAGETLSDKIFHYLATRSEPALVQEIAVGCSLNEASVRTVLSRSADRFARVESEGRSQRWIAVGAPGRDAGVPIPWT